MDESAASRPVARWCRGQLDSTNSETGSEGVERHSNFTAEARERAASTPRAPSRKDSLARERLAGAAPPREHQQPRRSLRDPETAAPSVHEGGHGEIGRPRRAAREAPSTSASPSRAARAGPRARRASAPGPSRPRQPNDAGAGPSPGRGPLARAVVRYDDCGVRERAPQRAHRPLRSEPPRLVRRRDPLAGSVTRPAPWPGSTAQVIRGPLHPVLP